MPQENWDQRDEDQCHWAKKNQPQKALWRITRMYTSWISRVTFMLLMSRILLSKSSISIAIFLCSLRSQDQHQQRRKYAQHLLFKSLIDAWKVHKNNWLMKQDPRKCTLRFCLIEICISPYRQQSSETGSCLEKSFVTASWQFLTDEFLDSWTTVKAYSFLL